MPWASGSEAGALCCSGDMCLALIHRNLVMTDEHRCILCTERVHVSCCEMDKNDKSVCWTCQAPPNGGGKPAAKIAATDEAVVVKKVRRGQRMVSLYS